MKTNLTRRDLLKFAAIGTSSAALSSVTGCEKPSAPASSAQPRGTTKADYSNEEYVWLSANANLPLFTSKDHPALRLAGQELGVKVVIAGPSSVDIPGLVAAVE